MTAEIEEKKKTSQRLFSQKQLDNLQRSTAIENDKCLQTRKLASWQPKINGGQKILIQQCSSWH